MKHPTTQDSDYRPAVGLVIFNKKGEVFIGRRRRQRGFWVWQFPQGGIDKGETPLDAAYRELHDLNVESPPEFTRYAWGSLDDAYHLIVPFKRKVYKTITQEFKRFSNV